jgi:hypothetical protein
LPERIARAAEAERFLGDREEAGHRMAYAFFNRPVEGAPRIGALLAASFPHLDSLIVPFEAGQEVVGEGDPTRASAPAGKRRS